MSDDRPRDPGRSTQWLAAVTLIAFVATLVTGYAVNALSGRLRDDTGQSLVKLEFAGWSYSSDKVLRAWDERGLLPTAIRAQKVDFFFAMSYGALALAAALLVWRARRGSRSGRVLAGLVALGAVAALCDEVENLRMWAILHGRGAADHVLPSMAAALKFALIAVAGVSAVLALLLTRSTPADTSRPPS
jgi:hypothetical protein